MDLKLSNNLFLGLQELSHLKQSLKERGYESIFKQMISSYGVVRPYNSDVFTDLQVIDSGLGQLTIKKGVAIDKDLNVINLKQDLVDAISITNDGVERYVVIKYLPTVIEQGKVDIQSDGSLVGIDTKFLSRLRGLPNFPSKITFPQSSNNTEQYTIQAVQNDTLASLNVAAQSIVQENNQKYSVVGTFTPGITVPQQDQYPFVQDNFVVQVRDSNQLIEGQEFLLAKVVNNQGVVSITDQRITNIFNFLTRDSDARNSVDIISDIIACTEVKYKFTPGTIDSSIVKIEWGLISDSWDIDQDSRKLTLFNGSGGTWNDLSQFSQGDFIGQYVVFEDGQSAKIINSNVENSEVTLELEYQVTFIQNGTIRIAPPGLIQLEVSHLTKQFKTIQATPAFAGRAYIELAPGQYNVKYKIIDDKAISTLQNINDNDYLNESSFNENGFVIPGGEAFTTSLNGDISVTQSDNSFFTILNKIVFPGVIWDFYGNETQIPQGWVVCDGGVITDPNSPFTGQNAPNLKGKVTVGFDQEDPDYSTVGNTGGSKEHILTEQQMPTHTHEITDPGHSHGVTESITFGRNGKDNGSFSFFHQSTTQTESSSTGITINDSGGDQPHENRQPYYVALKIMKI